MGVAASLQVAQRANPRKCGGNRGEQGKVCNIKGQVAEGTRLGSNRLWGFFDFGEDMNSALFVQAYDIVLSEGAIGISRAI